MGSFVNLSPFTVQVFDQYVKTRAEEERKEKKNKLMQAKDDFRKMMEDARFHIRSVLSRPSLHFECLEPSKCLV